MNEERIRKALDAQSVTFLFMYSGEMREEAIIALDDDFHGTGTLNYCTRSEAEALGELELFDARCAERMLQKK